MSFLRNVLRFCVRMVGKAISVPTRLRLRAFHRSTHYPEVTQRAILERILAEQRDTGFGRDHHFASIRTLEDFRRNIPVAGYEAIEPYIARMRQGDFKALVAAKKVHMFALTSGTTATRKYIPVTPHYLSNYKRGWNMWGMRNFQDHKVIKLKPIVQLSGDWNECQTEFGTPCGAVTGLTASMQKRFIRWLYCVPPEVGCLKDVNAKYYLAMRLSVPKNVGLVIAANPSTLINLARAGDRDKESLIRDIHDGTLTDKYAIPEHVRAACQHKFRADPARAHELEAIVSRTGTLYPKDYWPSYCVLGNWTGGSMGAYLRHYPRYFGSMPVRDIGLIASEGRMTIPMTDHSPAGILDIGGHYYEFIPEEEGDSKNPTVLGAHELQEGKHYYILLTTMYGLYRYHIRDVVRVAGFHNQTPLLEFLSKGSHFANLTGEKLSEYHVTQAMQELLREQDLMLSSYSLAPCWPSSGEDELTPYYGLFVERPDLPSLDAGLKLAHLLDEKLAQLNVEYASKRDTQRLGAVRLQMLPGGTWQEWDRKRLAKTGGSAEQYKHPCLINDTGLRESLPVLREEVAI